MTAHSHSAVDTRAIEIATEARTVAEATRETVHAAFRDFERLNSAQHDAVSAKVDRLRDHVSNRVGDVHRRIDRLVILIFCAVVGLLASIVAWLVDNAVTWRGFG